jgi:hypothetical protein
VEHQRHRAVFLEDDLRSRATQSRPARKVSLLQ